MSDPTDLDVALEAARAGAEVVASHFGRVASATWKSDVDPVTEIDHASERAILEVIGFRRPTDEVLAEEAGGPRDSTGRTWIVDPLDGTVNFLHGIPQVAVSVALHEGGAPLVGVVTDPLRGEEYHSVIGGGAYLDGSLITVSSTQHLSDALVATGFPYDRWQNGRSYAGIVGEVLTVARGVRRLGSAALDLAWVAAGRFDAYWEFGLGPWDIAAGMLLIREAGGTVTDLHGRESTVLDQMYIAGGESIQKELRATLAAAMPPGWPENR